MSQTAEGKREELLAETVATRRRESNKFLSVIEIMDEQDLAKQILALVIPMTVVLVVSSSELVKTTQVQLVVISLSLATALTCNGLLLRKTYIEISTVCLMLGAALMMFSYFTLLTLFLPLYFIWIPLVCWLGSLIPLALYGWGRFRRDKQKDTEKGELTISKAIP